MASRLHQLLASHIADHPLAQHARLRLAQFTLPAQQLAAAGALEPGALRRGDIDGCDLLLITGRQAADGLELAIQPRLEVLALALIDDLDIGPYPQLGAPLLEGIVRGIADGCVESDCSLVGGETAILPDMYQEGDYDLAGFCVGVVERKRLIDGSHMEAGDVAIGLASSGLHSNGYSLVRKVVFEMAGLTCDDVVAELDHQRVADILLTPTRLYARPIRKVLSHYRVKQVVHAISHITGGGIAENLSRVVPEHLQVEISRGAWKVPAVFRWIQRHGNVAEAEMDRVFNMGIGMVLVVSQHFAASIRSQIADCGIETFELGVVKAASPSHERSVVVD